MYYNHKSNRNDASVCARYRTVRDSGDHGDDDSDDDVEPNLDNDYDDGVL